MIKGSTIHRPDMNVPRKARAAESGQPGARPARPREPSVLELATNFTDAMASWLAAGVPVVDQSAYDARAAACGACSYWDGKARFGLVKCKAPGCGCTTFKRWLATERCKHPDGSRWPVLHPSDNTPAGAGK